MKTKRNGILNRKQGLNPQYFCDIFNAVNGKHIAANLKEHGLQIAASRGFGETPQDAIRECFLYMRRDYEYLKKPKIEGWRVFQLVTDNPLAVVELRLYLSANKEEDDD